MPDKPTPSKGGVVALHTDAHPTVADLVRGCPACGSVPVSCSLGPSWAHFTYACGSEATTHEATTHA